MTIDLDNLDNLTPDQREAARKVARELGLDTFLAKHNAAAALREAADQARQAEQAVAAARAEAQPKADYLRQHFDAEITALIAAHETALAELRETQRRAIDYALSPLTLAEEALDAAKAAHVTAEKAHADAVAADEAASKRKKKP